MALFGVPFLEYVLGIIVLVFIIYIISRSSSWSRTDEERQEIKGEKGLLRDTIKEWRLQRDEKKIFRKLNKNFLSFIVNYRILLDSSQGSTPRQLAPGQASMSPSELFKAIVKLYNMMDKLAKERTSIKDEKSQFNVFLKYWPIIYNEISAWPLAINQSKIRDYNYAMGKIKKIVPQMTSLIKELGSELDLEQKLDEDKKAQIISLYSEIAREEGSSQQWPRAA